jgi:hypothetical protein
MCVRGISFDLLQLCDWIFELNEHCSIICFSFDCIRTTVICVCGYNSNVQLYYMVRSGFNTYVNVQFLWSYVIINCWGCFHIFWTNDRKCKNLRHIIFSMERWCFKYFTPLYVVKDMWRCWEDISLSIVTGITRDI